MKLAFRSIVLAAVLFGLVVSLAGQALAPRACCALEPARRASPASAVSACAAAGEPRLCLVCLLNSGALVTAQPPAQRLFGLPIEQPMALVCEPLLLANEPLHPPEA